MKRFAKRTLVTAAFVLVTSPAAAAPKPMINYFQPMPIVGKLSTTVWGASTVGPRDPANGLEDSGAAGGVGPQQETNFYWDGKILYGNDGKYHLYATHWDHSNGFGPPGGGSTGWKNSIPMESISDNVMGPYVSQGNCYTKNLEGNDMGHNLTALIAPTGASPYTLSVGEIVPGQMFSASSPNGPWTSLGLSQTTTNGHSGCGSTSSNFTFTVGHDNRFWATSRAGCVMDSDQVLGPYKIETDSVLPNLENNDNHDAEDECIWYSGGYYHIVFNYWPVQRAYHIMSKDGITNWTSTGLAYQAAQTPANANSNWLRYTDGTVNVWHNMERVGVIVENGHPTHFTFAVTDVNKNVTGISQGGSKILVVPFNGVQFDCDNGDQASCDEVGAGAAGIDGGGAGGSIPVDGGTGGAVTADAGRGCWRCDWSWRLQRNGRCHRSGRIGEQRGSYWHRRRHEQGGREWYGRCYHGGRGHEHRRFHQGGRDHEFRRRHEHGRVGRNGWGHRGWRCAQHGRGDERGRFSGRGRRSCDQRRDRR
jgi:hypothetical protein